MAVVPLPERGIVRVGFVASDVTVKFPFDVPAAVGAKVTSRVTDWPAARVIGAEIPPRLKFDPLSPSCEIVMLDVSVLVNVSDKVVELPTVKLPKFSLAAEGANWPVVAPVPESATVATESEASLATERVALKLPAVFGVKLTFTGTLCPPVMVTGKDGSSSEKCLAEMLTLVMVTDAVPEFVAVVERLFVAPALTLPKFRVVAAKFNVLLGGVVECPTLTPWQPAKKNSKKKIKSAHNAVRNCVPKFSGASAPRFLTGT